MRNVRGLALLLLAGAAVASAQQSVDYASVSGRVTDPSGGVLQGAQVAVRQTETNVTTTAVTDKEGRFRFPYLKVGSHEIKVQYQGFAEATKLLSLGVGAAYELPIQLHVAAASEDVTVTAEATVLEAARSQIAATVSQAEVENLPMNGRNFVDLALLVPGVAPTNVGGTNLYPETSAVAGPSISVGSQRNLSNNFIVDGLSANDDAAALSGIPYGVDSVAQFQVVTSGGQAELGRALGGYVNVVTKSGTNSHHGELYGYLRDEGLNAANALTGNTLPMTHANFGISQGGPIVRDKTFYFLNLEKRNLDQSGVITISDANVAIINANLDRVGYLGPPISTGVFPIQQDLVNVLAKVDHEFSPSDRFSFRYSRYSLDAVNARNVGGLNAPSASTGLDNTDQTFAVSNVAILSSRTVLESRAQFAYSDFLAPPDDPIGPAVSIAGVASFGTSSGNPTGRLNQMYQVVNNLSHQSGAHAFRAGVDFIYNDDRVTYPRSVRGSYTFSSMANFLAGVYNNLGFTQTFGTSVIDQGNANVGLYVQDEWKVNPRLTLNAGLRYDLQFLESIDTDGNNVSPRLGFVWSPTASRRTLIRGSAGLFYDRVPLRALANALLSAGNTTDIGSLEQIGVSLSPTQIGAPRFPEILEEVVPTTTRVNLTTMDRNLQNAYSTQASVEVEHQIGEHATASVGYSYLKGQALIMSINQNVPACVASGNNNGCRPNSTYANNPQYSSAATSNYHGLHVSFVLRPTRWGLYRVSYALSKSMNNVGEAFFSSPIDNFDLSKDWARSDDDQRHRLTLNGTVQGPREGATTTWGKLTTGFELSAMLQYYSRLPFNITSGVTTVQGTAGRPIVDGEFIHRNEGIGSDFFTLNMRLSRKVKLGSRVEVEGIAEAFNLTNRRNDLTRNQNFGSGAYPTNPLPTFGQITAVGEARGFQFGLRLRY